MPWSLFVEAVVCSLNNYQSNTTQTDLPFATGESDLLTFDEWANFLNRVLNLIAIIQYKVIPGKHSACSYWTRYTFHHHGFFYERMKIIPLKFEGYFGRCLKSWGRMVITDKFNRTLETLKITIIFQRNPEINLSSFECMTWNISKPNNPIGNFI